MLDVERQKSNALQADVFHLRAKNLQLSQRFNGSEEEVAQLQARCDEFCCHFEPTQHTRDELFFSQELELMLVAENQRDSAVAVGGGTGTDATAFIEGVQPSSSVAAGDRLILHLNSSYSAACVGDTQENHKEYF